MKVRIFSALTMQEAMNQVKETLGRDAIILHTRKFRKGGIGGFFGREMIEVMAAVDNDIQTTTSTSKSKQQEKNKERPRQKHSPVVVKSLLKPEKNIKKLDKETILEENNSNNINREDNTIAQIFNANAQVMQPLLIPQLKSDEKVDVVEQTSVAVEEKKIIVVDNQPKDEDLKAEITGMRFMLEQLLEKTKTPPDNPWYDYLINKDLSPNFAEQILKGFPYSLTMLNKNPEATKKMLSDRLEKYIRTNSGVVLSQQECTKIALIGPTGVGKTTTLAKIAAKFTLENNADVAFITSDTYRIAAVEQLKTYANILNIPLDVVYSPNEMRKCLEKHKDKQLVLIDTAGRSQYNQEQMEELKILLEADQTINNYLVLSSTTKSQDASDIIDRFSYCGFENIIFTKIDEAKNIGNIFNLMHQFPDIYISYITNGQSVPDDIHNIDSSYLTNILLRD